MRGRLLRSECVRTCAVKLPRGFSSIRRNIGANNGANIFSRFNFCPLDHHQLFKMLLPLLLCGNINTHSNQSNRQTLPQIGLIRRVVFFSLHLFHFECCENCALDAREFSHAHIHKCATTRDAPDFAAAASAASACVTLLILTPAGSRLRAFRTNSSSHRATAASRLTVTGYCASCARCHCAHLRSPRIEITSLTSARSRGISCAKGVARARACCRKAH